MPTVEEIEQTAETLRKQLAQIDKLTGKTNLRDRESTRKRRERESTKLVRVPRCKDRTLREELETSDEKWLRFYFPDLFWYDWTIQQREMIRAIAQAIVVGDDQAIAASRGEGKTKIAERLLLKYTLQGSIKLSVLFAAKGEHAEDSLNSIKAECEENPLLFDAYPEVCQPVRELQYTPNRAHYQLVQGDRHDNLEPYEMASSRFSWCGQEITFPNVPGSPAAAGIIATRGLDSAVRGLNKLNRRVDVAIIDDPDTEDSARSEEQAAKLERRIDRAIGGLGGQQRSCGRVVITTIQSRTAVSYKLTDPLQKPSMKGRRFKFLIQPPERMDLWDEYVQLRQQDWNNEREENPTTLALDFYIDHREEMDAGSEVANKYRFKNAREILESSTYTKGFGVQISALQFYYDQAAGKGIDFCQTELDNDPPEEEGPIESGISAGKILRRLSGYPRRIVPPNCTIVTQGIDVQKGGLHYVVKAWQPDGTNYVIDYAYYETKGTVYRSSEGIEFAIHRAVLGRMEQLTAPASEDDDFRMRSLDGSIVPVTSTLIDSGYQAPPIYQACREIGPGIYTAKGHGKSHGCAQINFTPHFNRDHDTRPGDGWYQKKQGKESAGHGLWLTHCDTDRWKSFEHARWLTPEGKPGAGYLFGEISDEERKYLEKREPKESKEHRSFAAHLTAEIETDEVVRGNLRKCWKLKSGRAANHYFDASYLADVAAWMNGIRLIGEVKVKKLQPMERPTARELAQRAG